MSNLGHLKTVIFDWQTLIGAAIGAAAAFLLWVIAEFYRAESRRKERIFVLGRVVAMNIITAADAYQTMHAFIYNQLQKLIDETDKHISDDSYFLGTCFFPLFSVEPTEVDLVDIKTGSGYVDSRMIDVMKKAKDFASVIDDARRQFATTLESHRELSLAKANRADVFNQQYKSDLENFQGFMQTEVLDKVVPVYIKTLLSAQIALTTLEKMPLWLWKFKFGQSFRYFPDKTQLKDHVVSAHQRIQDSLSRAFNARLEIVNAEFDPPLKIE